MKFVFTENDNQPITHLYIQLDNTNYNKGYGLLSALASLIKNGIVKKVLLQFIQPNPLLKVLLLQIKISFLIVGHTHADVDALIGTIVSYLRNVDQMSPEEFAEAVGEACKSANGAIDRVENSLSTPDYESQFGSKRIRSDLDGITECREIRLSAGLSPDHVMLHYKVSSLCLDCCVPFHYYLITS